MKLQDRENMAALGIFLGGVALSAALMLALISQWTAEPIRAAQEKTRQAAFHRLLLPEFDSTGEAKTFDDVTFYPVLSAGKTVGFVGQGFSRAGYGGEIEALVGFDLSGKITCVQILRHRETPGLGANVCERKFQRTIANLCEKVPEVPENLILDQFCGKSAAAAGNWRINKDGGSFEYLTGATVTSRAVTALTDRIAESFAKSKMAESVEEK
ncbi:MAG: RnfABCDGE type electron transport complex subunit G [Lentisphaerae bacterium]|nr:RnfABCDGE type electron transport complex subunit G [Lentisphaerota bacterium]